MTQFPPSMNNPVITAGGSGALPTPLVVRTFSGIHPGGVYVGGGGGGQGSFNSSEKFGQVGVSSAPAGSFSAARAGDIALHAIATTAATKAAGSFVFDPPSVPVRGISFDLITAGASDVAASAAAVTSGAHAPRGRGDHTLPRAEIWTNGRTGIFKGRAALALCVVKTCSAYTGYDARGVPGTLLRTDVLRCAPGRSARGRADSPQ
jgi:hypothetical protein